MPEMHSGRMVAQHRGEMPGTVSVTAGATSDLLSPSRPRSSLRLALFLFKSDRDCHEKYMSYCLLYVRNIFCLCRLNSVQLLVLADDSDRSSPEADQPNTVSERRPTFAEYLVTEALDSVS